jgi:hypothetical protein
MRGRVYRFGAMLLIDDREPRRERRDESIPSPLLVAGAGFLLVFLAGVTPGVVGLLMLLVGFILVCRAVLRAIGDPYGMREHRQ